MKKNNEDDDLDCNCGICKYVDFCKKYRVAGPKALKMMEEERKAEEIENINNSTI